MNDPFRSFWKSYSARAANVFHIRFFHEIAAGHPLAPESGPHRMAHFSRISAFVLVYHPPACGVIPGAWSGIPAGANFLP